MITIISKQTYLGFAYFNSRNFQNFGAFGANFGTIGFLVFLKVIYDNCYDIYLG